MTNKILDTIKRRRSIREFCLEQISIPEIEAIVEAGQYAPNGSGEAWHFTVIQNIEVLSRLNKLAKEFAATCGLPWLEQLGKDDGFHSTYNAPTVILVSGEERNVCSIYDVSAATENILLAAESLDIGSCWGYFVTQAFNTVERDDLYKELQIPEGYKVYISIMLGYKTGNLPISSKRKEGCITFII